MLSIDSTRFQRFGRAHEYVSQQGLISLAEHCYEGQGIAGKSNQAETTFILESTRADRNLR